MRLTLTGNQANAWGVKLSRVQVVAAYPITPQTTIVEELAEFAANGELAAKYIKVESEHSAMAACIAAENTGVRTYTASSSHGIALMHEMLHWAVGARLPIVMGAVNRAMGPPWNIWADHTDTISQRDTGWMQFYVESNQEVLDTIIQAYKVAESKDVMLPAMAIEDAFILSHTVERVEIPDQELVDEFLPPYDPPEYLNPGDPKGFGSLVMPDWYMEFRYLIAKAQEAARKRIREVTKEYAEIFGRDYGGLVEEYRTEDADVIMIGAGTMVSTARDVIDKLRSEGHKIGLVKMRVFRPFPYEEIQEIAKNVDVIGVMDRAFTFGYGGAMFNEVKAAIYNTDARPKIKNYLIGIGGRDVTAKMLEDTFRNALRIKDHGLDKEIMWVDLKGGE
jgi:2-oxoisovalerate ferredoxin oxidoreductase alpha subunit